MTAVKIPKKWTSEKISVIFRKFENFGFIFRKFENCGFTIE